jgi:hypothetical protein
MPMYTGWLREFIMYSDVYAITRIYDEVGPGVVPYSPMHL